MRSDASTLMGRVATYFHTIKYMKISQIYFRIVKKLQRPTPRIMVAQSKSASENWLSLPIYNQKLFENSEVEFLNQRGSIETSNGWNDESKSKLWLYNIQYFDDLCASTGESRIDQHTSLIERWIRENPAPIGNGWEPYPSSLRIVNWIKFFLSNDTPSQYVLDSVAQQADFLLQNLERHILGNHLFANAKALVFAGLYLDGPDAKNWLDTGLRIYRKEVVEQVLSDGGNFELSPMYHSIMLVDLLDLINVFGAYPNKIEAGLVLETKKVANKMLSWLLVMTHDDGELSFFNDTAIGVAAKPAIIYEYAGLLGVDLPVKQTEKLTHLVDSGYSRIQMTSHSLYFDHAKVGPDYLPGHAHADTLSIEWTVMGQRVLVNSGTSMYGLSDERLRQRGTDAHNTVMVDGENSSEVWSGFRVARRAYATVSEASETEGVVKVTASHDGYQRLKGKVTHTRSIAAEESRMQITDNLSGKWSAAEAMYHLHPDIKVGVITDHSVQLSLPNKQVVSVESTGKIILSDGFWYPEFGVSISNKNLKIVFDGSELNTSFSLEG